MNGKRTKRYKTKQQLEWPMPMVTQIKHKSFLSVFYFVDSFLSFVSNKNHFFLKLRVLRSKTKDSTI